MVATKNVVEKYRNALTLATRSIEYKVIGEKHVVIMRWNSGEDISPDAFRYGNIENARNKWVELRGIMKRDGYVKV